MTVPRADDSADPMTAAAHTASAMLAAAQHLPDRSAGTDASGVASAELAPDGTVLHLRVEPGWERSVDPERLGQAVVAAVQGAAQAQFEAMSRAGSNGPWNDGPRSSAAAPAPLPPAAVPQLPDGARPRPLEDLAEAVSGLLRTFDATTMAPAQGIGTAANGAVTITVGAYGFAGCDIDARWADRRSGLAISSALGEALDRATADLQDKQTAGAGAPERQEVQSIFAEAMAHLQELSVAPAPITTKGL